MPRKTVEIPQCIEYVSVLDHDGQLDEALEPELTRAELRRLYKTLLASRELDRRALNLQRQGRVGTYATCEGQEAASLGAAFALGADDWMVPSFRENAALLWRGWSMTHVLLFWGGYEAGNIVPDGVNDTPLCVPVASQCQYAMGIAWGLQKRATKNACLGFVGDGGTSEGDFHEAMNFAGVYRVPLVMVVQNNQWAISLPREKQTASATIAQKALAYGFDGVQVDGNDLLAMIVVTREAIAKARAGGGPTLIEALTYRVGSHTSADDPKKYRSEEETARWRARDPIARFRAYLQRKGLLDEKVEQIIQEEVQREVDDATRAYERVRQQPLEFLQYVYAEPTADLAAQARELGGELPPRRSATGQNDRSRTR